MSDFKNFGKLPGQPSKLLKLAMKDFEACELSDDYKIDLDVWHRPNDEVCVVCLAGSVMAQTLQVSRWDEVTPVQYEEETPALRALDEFRLGEIREGLDYLDLEYDSWTNVAAAAYDDNLDQFKADMYKMIEIFEKEGL